MAACPPAACPHDGVCYYSKENREKLLQINCMLKALSHHCQCSSARARGDPSSSCHCETQEQEMLRLLDEIRKSVDDLYQDHTAHASMHNLRPHKGRGACGRDSGYHSGVLRQSGGSEAAISMSSPSPRQPSEHPDVSEDDTDLQLHTS